MKKLTLFFVGIFMITSFSYAGGYWSVEISCKIGEEAKFKSGTYNIGEIQNYNLWVSTGPYSSDCWYNHYSIAEIRGFDKNNQQIPIAHVNHYNTMSTGESQVNTGPIYVQYFSYSLWVNPDYCKRWTTYAKAVIYW